MERPSKILSLQAVNKLRIEESTL